MPRWLCRRKTIQKDKDMNIAICAIVKDEDFYIDEFIKYHLKLGVNHIYFFQNNWRYDEHGKYRENFHAHWLVQDGEV